MDEFCWCFEIPTEKNTDDSIETIDRHGIVKMSVFRNNTEDSLIFDLSPLIYFGKTLIYPRTCFGVKLGGNIKKDEKDLDSRLQHVEGKER